MKSAVTVMCNKAELTASKRVKATLLLLRRIFNKIKLGEQGIDDSKVINKPNSRQLKGIIIDEAEARNIANENMENELKELLSGGDR